VREYVPVRLLGVRVAALRIFGGIIFFVVGYNYVTKGDTIAEFILLGERHSVHVSFLVLLVGVAASSVAVRKRMWAWRRCDQGSCNITSKAVSHLGTISQASCTVAVTPVFATARHFGLPPPERKRASPHASTAAPWNVALVITPGSQFLTIRPGYEQ
jgi:hypothetical protein